MEEGCLSVPGLFVEVNRAAAITVEGQNPDGSLFSLECDGLLAVCFQHEMDHLLGKLFVDYISSLKRDRIRTKLVKMKRNNELG